jgi:NADH-quinone oxidoreductase subunit L
MIDKIWLVVLFPLLGVVINGLAGIKFPRKLTGAIGSLAILGSFITAGMIFVEVAGRGSTERISEVVLFTWIGCGSLQVNAGFLVDPLSLVMMLAVSGVSFIIHVYSTGYMAEDEGFRRYFTYLNLFVFFMLLLVSANSFLLMFVGWEGVGLCSYLLIGFWYQRQAPADAGKKAFVVNRVGDYGFLLAMLLIFVTFNTLDFNKVFAAAPQVLEEGGLAVTLMTLLLFVGACGKSAQIPLYVWLPDAMEGPTPVSALIHAATMVTAGVYMVARCATLYSMAPVSMEVVAIIGCLTALFAASIGLLQNDIKRVLAYSTISQLGYMFLACGVGVFSAGIFHLVTHAFFKALLFLGAGSVMHGMSGELDMRKMGGLRTKMPWTFWTFLIGTLALAGIFPFAGFFSKDEILWAALQKSPLLWLGGALGAFMTAFYMFRAVFMTFYGESRIESHVHVHESPSSMVLPLCALAVLSIAGGWIGLPLIEGGNQLKEFLQPLFSAAGHAAPAAHAAHETGLEITMMIVSLGIAFSGIALAWVMYIKNPLLPEKLAERFSALYRLVYNKYFVDEAYDALIIQPIKNGSLWLWRLFDEKVLDGAVNGSAALVQGAGGVLRRLQTGLVQEYALGIVGGVVAIFYILFFLT